MTMAVRLLSPRIAAAADSFLGEIGFETIDPSGSISTSSRRLCAGLGALSQAAYMALGGCDVAMADRIGLAGAMLSLLTKLDDQVIDAPSFHRGFSRAEAKARTREYLAPTLASIVEGRAASDDPRCIFAARLGRILAELGPVDTLLAAIARGWEVQTEAVSILTRHAREVTLDEVECVTRDISGVWLLMITIVGSLPIETRALSSSEVAAFEGWGDAIQKADALNDLQKDITDGHWATYPLRLLFEHSPEAYAEAHAGAPIDPILEAHAIPRACLDTRVLAAARSAHRALGDVPVMLDWVHRHLIARSRFERLARVEG